MSKLNLNCCCKLQMCRARTENTHEDFAVGAKQQTILKLLSRLKGLFGNLMRRWDRVCVCVCVRLKRDFMTLEQVNLPPQSVSTQSRLVSNWSLSNLHENKINKESSASETSFLFCHRKLWEESVVRLKQPEQISIISLIKRVFQELLSCLNAQKVSCQ